jgi:hypothetical protein
MIFALLVLTVDDLAFAQETDDVDKPMIASTDKGLLDVELSLSPVPVEPDRETKLQIRFLQKDKSEVQQHIDYRIFIEKDGSEVFRIPNTHTNPGEVTMPYTFTSTGNFLIGVEIVGIHFQPIPTETATFSVVVVPEFPVGAAIAMAGAIATVLLFTHRRLIPMHSNVK